MTTVAFIQARYDSSRLPGKVLKELAGMPVLAWIVRAAKAIPGIDKVVVATADDPQEDPIAAWCKGNDTACFRGDKNDVLKRLADAAAAHKAGVVVRLTADCPFLDPHICAQTIYALNAKRLDFTSNAHPSTWPDGLDCEVMTRSAVERAAAEAVLPSHREHVTPYLRANRTAFSQLILRCPIPGLNGERWTLDTPRDLGFLEAVAWHLPRDRAPAYMEVLQVLDAHPELREINSIEPRQRSLLRNISPDFASSAYTHRDYSRSAELLARAEKVIPLGTQTFSKSRLLFPAEKAPLFLTHGLNGRVWDVDGNAYVDYICALLPIILGYCDPDVDAAVSEQLSRGISFSLATELETELAERLVRLIPCAEKVRFGKNGTDATSGAIRLARAFTSRDRVAVCGYHGWQDWYIGSTTRNKGVPSAVQALTHTFAYGDLDALDALLGEHPNEFAAVMLEPATFAEPPAGYLEGIRDITHRHGALLIFDEIITGFRFALGGAQQYFGVTPDLAAFGKAMGNGMPISACVGRADVMQEMENVFYSGTFGGEALSLAASIATIDKLEKQNVIKALWSHGDDLEREISARIEANSLSSVLRLTGFSPWRQLAITSTETEDMYAIRTFIMRSMFDHGVLVSSTHNICFAHDDLTLAQTLTAYDAMLPRLAEALREGNLESQLDCQKIQPIFTVRAAAN